MKRRSMNDVASPQNADETHQNPKSVEQYIRFIPLESGAPGQHDGIRGVKNPDEHERALRSQPADETETENAH